MVRTDVGERVRVNFYFDTEVFEGLRRLARLNNTTYSELIRIACREYIARHIAQAQVDNTNLKELIK
jgi:hypothetical protein